MPPLPTVSHALRVDFHALLGTDTNIQNKLFFTYSGAVTLADAATLATLCATEWGTHINPALTTDYTLRETQVTDLDHLTGSVGVDTSTHSGANVAPALPAEACMVLDYKIARRYRGGKPKAFVSGQTNSGQSDEQLWTSGYSTGFASNWQAMVSAIIAGAPSGIGTLVWVNVSYFQGFTNFVKPSGRASARPTLRSVPVVDPIISVVGRQQIGSQRRRSKIG